MLPGDDAESLAARVLAAEHKLYPRCLALVAAGQITIEGGTCRLPETSDPLRPSLINPP